MAIGVSSFEHPVIAAMAVSGDRASRVREWDDNGRDQAWMARIRTGDATALDALATAYGAALARFAEHVTGSPDLGDEAAQDVFIALWEQRTSLDIRGSVGGYLYRAVRHRALNLVRHERSQARRAAASTVARADRIDNAAAAQLDADDLRAEVLGVLESVPTRCREIFLLVWANELTYLEVATVLGVGVRTVQNQYYRAVSVLAQHFGRSTTA